MTQGKPGAIARNDVKAKQDELGSLLVQRKAWLSSVLPKHLTADMLIRVAVFARSRSQELLECSNESVLRAVMEAAEMGLSPTGVSGGAWLVPFRNKKTGKREAICIPDWRGYIRLALQSGKIRKVEARVVYANDPQFEVDLGDKPSLRHKPNILGDKGEPVAFYCVATLNNGDTLFEVMSAKDVSAVMARSPTHGDSGPWKTDFTEMGRKTVVRRAQKYWPKSKRLDAARAADESHDEGMRSQELDSFMPDDVVAPPEPEDAEIVAPEEQQQQASLPKDGSLPKIAGAMEIKDAPDPIDTEVVALKTAIEASAGPAQLKMLVARIMALPDRERAEVRAVYEFRSKSLTK